jgi:hypothetical protein
VELTWRSFVNEQPKQQYVMPLQQMNCVQAGELQITYKQDTLLPAIVQTKCLSRMPYACKWSSVHLNPVELLLVQTLFRKPLLS